MHLRTRISLMALAVTLPMMAQAQSVDDFTLESAPSPTATPQAQGPADTRSGVEIRPRAVNTPAPRPTVAPTPSLSVELPEPRPSATASAPQSSPLPRVTPRPVETVPAQPQVRPTSVPLDGTGFPPPSADPAPAATAPPSPVSPPVLAEAGDSGDGLPWLPIGAAAALLALLGAGFLFWKRRQVPIVPEIERPLVADAQGGESVPLADALSVRVENEKLIRSAAYATLKYRLILINRTNGPLSNVAVGIDLVSAHAGAPMEQQIATVGTALEKRHDIARISPRQNVTLEGQVQLPLAQAHVIRQGRYPLLVPLMRVRVDGPGEEALLKTFVVGQGIPGGGRVQPFRLDEGPRSYAPIAQRELARVDLTLSAR
ncbi:hypothetical protein [Qipengyuania qiaonensis]|uniref:LPXTG cell wall anchor domain-containing protein n=1 Tax=Qipengyuania qiaonensis TaxID=2867240 RepID=A0ABS7J562_9SPHN|nr:hypothetical protein [Qipengyuania qiaonensis]MBX7482417.1 hypothetical protein [Qipengyuania qiaonensis]